MSATGTMFRHQQTVEEELLLCAMRTELDDATCERIQALAERGVAWEQLCTLATEHKVAAFLWRTLDKVCPTAIPDTARKSLKVQVQIHIQESLFLTKELLSILNLFSQQDVPAIPYKGAVLATSVYGDLTLRPFSDLDILVHEADVVRALELLRAQGYRLIRPSRLAHLAEDLQAAQVRKLISDSSWAYQLVLAHVTSEIVVELHWRVLPPYVFAAPCAELWQHRQSVSIAGASFSTFSPENLLWFLCVHGAKHQWERLSWVCDVAQLLHTFPNLDWQGLIAYAQNKGILRRLYLGLLLAHGLLDAPLPDPIRQQISANSVVHKLAYDALAAIREGRESDVDQSYLIGLPFQLRSDRKSVV